MNRKRKTVFKSALIGITAIAASLTIGLSSACKTNKKDETNDEEDKVTTKVDNQLLKNGNFEFYSDNKGLYPISNPDSWSLSSTGFSNVALSGVIDTKPSRWNYLTDPELPQKLEDNDDLESDDENKKDYNGALTNDMPYKNPHKATENNATDDDKEYIANPYTHKYRSDSDGKIYDENNAEVITYADEDGKLYLDSELKTPLETSVLMLHNYRQNYYTGTESYFSSSTTISLEASTAAKISLWVKTSDLYFDGATGERTEVKADHGAYVKVATTVGGSSIDPFVIRNINTEQLNPDGLNNGWVQYTVYVEASTFASTGVTLSVGLGEDSKYTVEGYAFFDDIEITKYLNSAEMAAENPDYTAKINSGNTSHPISPEAKTSFRVDKVEYQTNGDDGNITTRTEENNFADRHYLIDFASSTPQDALSFGNVSAGLTVDDTQTGKFVCSKPEADKRYFTELPSLANDADKAYLPHGLNSIDVSEDFVNTVKISKEEGWKFKDGYLYSDLLTDALKTATALPGADGNEADALVMVSARGAAYQAEITDDKFVLDDDRYALISFWIKTSDMGGSTAATIKAVDLSDEDNSSSFTVDSTSDALVTIGDKDDVYNGWVKCFVRVANNSGKDGKQFKLVVNFGNTTISGTTLSSYKAGWLAVTNASITELDEDVYGYTSDLSHSTTLTFTETEENSTSHNFDTASGDSNVIKYDLANLSSYTGVNGASINVAPTGNEAGDYDKRNSNSFAGLLNTGNLDNYTDKAWFSALKSIEIRNNTNLNAADNSAVWDSVFNKYTVQPLLIVNTVREFNEQSKIYNYGYIGNAATVSANGYSAISVRVKASKGAIANIYLTENKTSGGKVLSYELPEYNFWYDDNGNILKGEPDKDATTAQQKANIAYNIRKDGLYELNGANDGKLYANFYNLEKYYDLRYEHSDFYDESGKLVNFKDLVQGETYYANAEKTAYAPHHLIAGGEGNNKVYEYKSGLGGEACYYYMEKKGSDSNNVANTSKVVYGVDTNVASLRYKNTAVDTPYHFTIDTTTPEGAKYADKWVTVTFYVHAGSQSKSYRLELWSGKRDEVSSYKDNTESYVIFDYNSISLNADTYNNLVNGYTDEIANEYKSAITDKLEDNNANLAELEKIYGSKVDKYNYLASYYTFSLYDSAAFIPFNGETADENQSGYSYEYSEYEEGLAFLRIEDTNLMTMSAFIDYSVVDKDIDIIGAPTVPAEDDDHDHTDEATDSANFWLLFASIALVAVMVAVIIVLAIRQFLKKHRRSKTATKNSYNFNKNKRYVKKYVKANGEAPEIAEDNVDESLLKDKADDEATEEASEESVEETPAEDTPVEEAPAEDTPDENGEQSESTDSDKPDDGENK